MIVSSHVLNEVERLADRLIVLVHGRLAAAGGHRAIRDAMDDRPRHVSCVRTPTRARLAAALVGLDAVGGISIDGVDASWLPSDRARELAIALPRLARASASGSTRCARSTTRSRACSGSWSVSAATAALGLHAAGFVPPKRWWTLACPASAAVLFGLLR